MRSSTHRSVAALMPLAPLPALAENHVLWAGVVAWFAAQVLKIVITLARTHRLDLRLITASGGMPSSHSALVTGLATAVARLNGLGSTDFAIAAAFAGVVMYDASGVRQAVSKQARILNFMMDDFFHERGIDAKRLGELIGHTPIEVLIGALLGILFGLVMTI